MADILLEDGCRGETHCGRIAGVQDPCDDCQLIIAQEKKED